MPIVKWIDSFSLGVEVIDAHHRHLVDLLNRVYDDVTSGEPVTHIEAVLSELFDYATYHFATEEAWMREMAYEGLEGHARQHLMFTERLTELVNDYHEGLEGMNMEVFSFLTRWLLDHMLEADRDIIRRAIECDYSGMKFD